MPYSLRAMVDTWNKYIRQHSEKTYGTVVRYSILYYSNELRTDVTRTWVRTKGRNRQQFKEGMKKTQHPKHIRTAATSTE